MDVRCPVAWEPVQGPTQNEPLSVTTKEGIGAQAGELAFAMAFVRLLGALPFGAVNGSPTLRAIVGFGGRLPGFGG